VGAAEHYHIPKVMSGKQIAGVVHINGQSHRLNSGFGPDKKVPDGKGMNIVSGSHLEGHAVQMMKRMGAKHARLVLPPGKNTCHWCKRMVPMMLGDGCSLDVVQGKSGGVQSYKGKSKEED